VKHRARRGPVYGKSTARISCAAFSPLHINGLCVKMDRATLWRKN
jgi:hypothetical protein